MLMPSIFGENLFDDWFDFDFPTERSFGNIDRKLYGKKAAREMKTDVHEHDDHFELLIDLPGFKKDELNVHLENGYLTVEAAKGLDKDTQDKTGKVIRQERYAGAMQRSFYVGEAVTEGDIRAKFENGVLTVNVAKKEAEKLPERKAIEIHE